MRTPPVIIDAFSSCPTGRLSGALRFDGVESIYRVWLNGIEVGVGKGSRLVQEFDIHEVCERDERDLCSGAPVVVDESTSEDQDQWWLPGHFPRLSPCWADRTASVDDLWLGPSTPRMARDRSIRRSSRPSEAFR
jgi:beta-galactosidase